MKKLLMLFILIPVSIFAQFFEGTVTFNDDTTKKGHINIPDYPDQSNLIFKLEEKSKTEKIKTKTIKGFEIINYQKETIEYITIYLAYDNPFNPQKPIIIKRKNFVRIVKKGKITLCAIDKLYIDLSTFPLFLNPHIITSYCIKRQNQDYAHTFGHVHSYERNPNIYFDGFNGFKETIQKYFEKECPKLAGLIDKEDFKKNGMGRIVDLYDQNCE